MTVVGINKNRPNGKRFNIFMDDFFSGIPSLLGEDLVGNVKPSVPVNIKETANGFLIDLLAPGFEKEDFKISLEKNILTIAAEKKNEATEENEKQIRREFTTQSFNRSFTINELVDAQQIVAKYLNGILTVNLPRKEEVKPPVKEITIQ
jgi:HSP20 family protein